MKKKWLTHGLTLSYLILIFILSSLPSLRPPDLGLNAEDKIAHMVEYGILGVLLCRSALAERKMSVRLMVWVFCIGVLYGAGDELHQSFVPNRFASFWDGLADAVGVLAGLAMFLLWKRHNKGLRN